jgi:hypothetical protein
MTFLRRLWHFGSGTDAAVSAKREQELDRHGHRARGQDWI